MMMRYQVVIRKEMDSADHRHILAGEDLILYPKKFSDGLNIFIECNDATLTKIRRKFKWILAIIPASEPIKIPYTAIQRNRMKRERQRIERIINRPNLEPNPLWNHEAHQ